MTGSLQIKNGKFYMVLNTQKNGKRKLKWLPTGLPHIRFHELRHSSPGT